MVISTKWNTKGLNLDSAQISQLENAGATTIEYFNEVTKEWEVL